MKQTKLCDQYKKLMDYWKAGKLFWLFIYLFVLYGLLSKIYLLNVYFRFINSILSDESDILPAILLLLS